MTDLHFMTIAQASAQIKARTLSPVELTQAFLARVKHVDAKLDSHLLVLEEQALADAKKAESEITAGNWKGPVSVDDLRLMRWLDEQFDETSFYGARRMVAVMRRDGFVVNRKRVKRLMRVMGIAAIYQKPNTSLGHPAQKVYRTCCGIW